MDLRGYLRAVRRHWWLVLVSVFVTLGGAWLVTDLTVPQYSTSVTFFVTTPSQGVTDAYQGGLFSTQRVKSYADLLTGDQLATAVAKVGGVGLTPAAVRQRIVARAIPDTVLLEATVTDSDANRSKLIAGELATRFINLVQQLETPAGADTPSVKVEVVAGPLLNPSPVTPNPTRNAAVGLILGLLIGLAAAALRELLDLTIKSAETLEEVVGAPVLAVVPFDPAAKQAPLVMDSDTLSARAESVRHLRTNLQFVDVDHPVKVIVVVSSVPNEGKSTTAVNLSIAFAEAGRKVMLIEADMRRPRVADYLGLEGAVGLSDVLAGQVAIDDVLQKWGRQDMWVLSSGSIPPNPSELLGSRNMAALLERQRALFDLIIIDTPPLLPVTDAAVVAAYADGAVLVARAGKTPQQRVRMAAASLRAVDARLLGCVLNMQRSKGATEYYYYRYNEEQPRGRRRLKVPTDRTPSVRQRTSARP